MTNEMLVHTEPTEEELRRVYRNLKAHGGFGAIDRYCRRTEERWVKYMRDKHRKAVVFEVGCQCVAIVWLDRYFPRFGTVEVHYGMNPAFLRPVMQSADFLLKRLLTGGLYSGLWAKVGRGDRRSGKLAARLGFRPMYLDEPTGEVLYLLS